MRDLVRLLGQGLVVDGAAAFGVGAENELVLPAKLEARAADRVVAELRRRMALGEAGRVRRKLVGDHAGSPQSEASHFAWHRKLFRLCG